MLSGDPSLPSGAAAGGKRGSVKPSVSSAGFDLVLSDGSDEGARCFCLSCRVEEGRSGPHQPARHDSKLILCPPPPHSHPKHRDPNDTAQLLWGRSADHGGSSSLTTPDKAAALLRHVLARASALPQPALGPGAHALLSQYARVLRQSTPLPVAVSHSEVLDALARIARASAALCGRREALEAPDAVLAVLLVDQTIVSKMGGGYQTALDLPGAHNLVDTNGRSVDQQLEAMAGPARRLFGQFGGGAGAPGDSGLGDGLPFGEEGEEGPFGGGDEEGVEGVGGCWGWGAGAAAAADGWGLALSGGESEGDD